MNPAYLINIGGTTLPVEKLTPLWEALGWRARGGSFDTRIAVREDLFVTIYDIDADRFLNGFQLFTAMSTEQQH